MKKLSFFNAKFQNSFQITNARISNLVILKWRPFEYKAEFSKNASSIWVQNGYF